MGKFLYQSAGLVALLILINSVLPVMGLIKLHRDYQTLMPPAVKLFKSKTAKQSDILVIGCSNMQHNIDMTAIRSSVHNADFLYYSGSQNSTFLRYLVDNHFTEGYKTIVLYTPYQMLEKNNFLVRNLLHYEGFACYQYTMSVMKHNPSAFFFNWNSYYDSIRVYRTEKVTINHPTYADSYVVDADHFVDSLHLPHTTYSQCTGALDHSRHYVVIPHFVEEDFEFVRSLKLKGQSLYVVFPPIPNIAENIKGMSTAQPYIEKIPDALNKPSFMDSTYFFDQWYHMNKCGSEIETPKLAAMLQQLNAKLGYSN